MTLSLTQSATAIAPNRSASFYAIGGVEPYTYSMLTANPGGTINADTGEYTAPADYSLDPKFAYDIIEVLDDDGEIATAQILVGSPFTLFCDIIQNQMGLANGRVYFWDQKIMKPSDNGLYIAVSQAWSKCFGNTNELIDNEQRQFVSMMVQLDLNVISRGPDARDRKEEVLMALNSIYSAQQQDANGFKLGTVPTKFINLSQVDGAAIPYRFQISVNMQYMVEKSRSAEYYDTFMQPEVTENI